MNETLPDAGQTGGISNVSNLGKGSRITGELHFPGAVEVPGHVKGRVEAGKIVIEESGEVDGELHAASIVIKGRFSGRVSGGDVRLYPTARVNAELDYDQICIDSGAELEGTCRKRGKPTLPGGS